MRRAGLTCFGRLPLELKADGAHRTVSQRQPVACGEDTSQGRENDGTNTNRISPCVVYRLSLLPPCRSPLLGRFVFGVRNVETSKAIAQDAAATRQARRRRL